MPAEYRAFSGRNVVTRVRINGGDGPTVVAPGGFPVGWTAASVAVVVVTMMALHAFRLVTVDPLTLSVAPLGAVGFIGFTPLLHRHEVGQGPLLVIEHGQHRVRLPRHGAEFPFMSVDAVHLLQGEWTHGDNPEAFNEISLIVRDLDQRLGRWPLFMVRELRPQFGEAMASRLAEELDVSLRIDQADAVQVPR